MLGTLRGFRRRGVETTGYFMVGIPGESFADRMRTFAAVRHWPLDLVHLSAFWPLDLGREPAAGAALRRTEGYLWAYCSPSRVLSLLVRGHLPASRIPTAARRMVHLAARRRHRAVGGGRLVRESDRV